MNGSGWRAVEADVLAIVAARHGNRFAVLGLHKASAELVLFLCIARRSNRGPCGRRPLLAMPKQVE
jgi:hypothetical protein